MSSLPLDPFEESPSFLPALALDLLGAAGGNWLSIQHKVSLGERGCSGFRAEDLLKMGWLRDWCKEGFWKVEFRFIDFREGVAARGKVVEFGRDFITGMADASSGGVAGMPEQERFELGFKGFEDFLDLDLDFVL